MIDELGQARTSVRGRELTLAALFVVVVAAGVWTVAIPALQQDSEPAADTDDIDARSPEPSASTPPAAP